MITENGEVMKTDATAKRTFFAFFVAIAVLSAIIGALTAGLLNSSGMEIISTAAITFVTVLTLSMTTYLFLDARSHDA